MGVHLLKKQHSWASSAAGGSGGSSGGGSSSGPAMPPKGCMAVRVVGPGAEAEEEERFVVPVGYLKHPLFVALLKAAEEEYGFAQKGAITIPCGVDHFRRVLQGIIHHRQKHHHSAHSSGSVVGGHHQGGGSNHHHFHIAGCFRA
ncbi:hypothetical protein BS78_10G276700 [Paspalum vaginatum]|nr:hypothetical protein BS78_10G276700 [Paspalum vaginatum]